jgi:hypothetical protein
LNPTPIQQLCEPDGRPYFVWDVAMTLDRFRELLVHPEQEVRDYWLATLLREARPDDVFHFVDLATIRQALPRISRGLGRQRAFWEWYLDALAARGQ